MEWGPSCIGYFAADVGYGSNSTELSEAAHPSMSAIPPISTVSSTHWCPSRSAKSGCEQLQQDSPLFDHLVGELLQKQRHIEAQCLGGLEVDDGLVFGRSLHREIGRIGSAKDAIDVVGRCRKFSETFMP
jgi:hypothetical protein